MTVTATPAGVTPMTIEVALDGWYTDRVSLNERQVRQLSALLREHVRIHDELLAEFAEAV
jgi:hypothetical protein